VSSEAATLKRTRAHLGAWLWYLVPANPILVRVVFAMSRRQRHLWLRFGYLAILTAIVTIMLLTTGTQSGSSLADLAKGASRTFTWAAITQLALMCFLAPVFTAGAITQEKDAQTYNILISTPLSNAQIVIGSLLSRLYFVLVLLLAGLPIFFTTMLYGGVTSGQILRSSAIAGSTAVLTGALAILISFIKVGTRRTIFSFFLGIALYLLVVWGLSAQGFAKVPEAPKDPLTGQVKLSWLAAFHPFLALQVALHQVQAPELAAVAHYGPIDRYFIAYPPMMYVVTSLALAIILVIVAMFFVRRVVREGEMTFWRRLAERLRLGRQQSTRKPHTVWSNPVAWREAVTRASATSRGVGRYAVILGGILAAVALLIAYLQGGAMTAAVTRQYLAGLVAIEFVLVLLIATNTAASALTKEKESKTLDILLTTPLTPSYIIRGKLRGLVTFVVPLIGIPVISLLLFAVVELLRRPKERVAFFETAFEIGALMIAFAAYACLLGLHFSLKQKKTVKAVLLAVGWLLVINLGSYYFWRAIVGEANVPGAALSCATPFTAIFTLIDPYTTLFDAPSTYLTKLGAVRVAALFGAVIFLGLHAAIVYAWYSSMVKSFDMIIRKQSGE
jgi:ABC-type transport system involved in multi-copper enzyme maturation permease subunit